MLSRIHGVQFEEQQHPVGGCIENATSLVTGYWCLTSLNIAEMISDIILDCDYLYTELCDWRAHITRGDGQEALVLQTGARH